MTLTGMWLTGAESALPAAGATARLYFATDTSRIFLDTGSAWVRLNLISRGTYAGGTTYYEKDLVTYNGSVWRALTTVTGVTPVEGANWTLFVSKGDAGTGIASIDGVSNNGGDVDLIAGTNVTITPNDGANTITIAASASSAPDASETVKGIAELATQTEADTGTDDLRIVTPLKLHTSTATETRTGVAEIATQTETDTGTDDARIVTPLKLRTSAATATRAGVVELATDAETTTGTDTVRATTPANVKAALDARPHYLIRDWAFSSGTLVTTTDTTALKVPIHNTGTIVSVRATLVTASSSGSVTVDVNKNGTSIWNTNQGNRPTFAASSTTQSVVTAFDTTSLATGDTLTVNIDAAGTGAAGLVVSVRYSY